MNEKLERTLLILERINQLILSFPIWLVIGFSGLLQRFEQEGWVESEENGNYGGMY